MTLVQILANESNEQIDLQTANIIRSKEEKKKHIQHNFSVIGFHVYKLNIAFPGI